MTAYRDPAEREVRPKTRVGVGVAVQVAGLTVLSMALSFGAQAAHDVGLTLPGFWLLLFCLVTGIGAVVRLLAHFASRIP